MRLAYVAGPYRSKLGAWGVAQNIERARVVARELWLMGFAVICPHANTSMMDGTDTDAMFLDGDLVMLERCDFIVMLPGWEASDGAKGELEHARACGLPAFFWPDDHEALSTVAAEPPALQRFFGPITVQQAAAIMGRHAAAQRARTRKMQAKGEMVESHPSLFEKTAIQNYHVEKSNR